MEYFNSVFNEYKNTTDKYESLYLFVIYDLPVEQVIDKIKNMINIVDQIQNPTKKNYIKNKLSSMMNYLEVMIPESNIESIFLIDQKVIPIKLVKEWKDTLVNFKVNKFTVRYGDNFEIKWLSDFLLDNSYVNVLTIKNNELKHYQLNSTKRKLHSENNIKNLIEYITENIGTKEQIIIHGVSGHIKNMEMLLKEKPNTCIKIYSNFKKDEEILLDLEIINNNTKSKILESWLEKITDPKDGNKIVFGKDIGISIKNQMLKTLFCTPKVANKLLETIDKELLIFEIITIKSYGNDIGRKLIDDYSGSIGIKFY